jgi:hypothetical protein
MPTRLERKGADPGGEQANWRPETGFSAQAALSVFPNGLGKLAAITLYFFFSGTSKSDNLGRSISMLSSHMIAGSSFT